MGLRAEPLDCCSHQPHPRRSTGRRYPAAWAAAVSRTPMLSIRTQSNGLCDELLNVGLDQASGENRSMVTACSATTVPTRRPGCPRLSSVFETSLIVNRHPLARRNRSCPCWRTSTPSSSILVPTRSIEAAFRWDIRMSPDRKLGMDFATASRLRVGREVADGRRATTRTCRTDLKDVCAA